MLVLVLSRSGVFFAVRYLQTGETASWLWMSGSSGMTVVINTTAVTTTFPPMDTSRTPPKPGSRYSTTVKQIFQASIYTTSDEF